MAHKWNTIKTKLSPERRAQIKKEVADEIAAMPLQELRRARALSQVRLAELMEMSQPEVSKIESRTDLYVSTLRSYIEAMGGELDIVARFPEGDVRVTQFHEKDEEKERQLGATR